MRKKKKIVLKRFDALEKTDRTMQDVYEAIFTRSDDFAYEMLEDFEIREVTYRQQDEDIKAFAAYLSDAFPDVKGAYIAIDLPNLPVFMTAFWGVLMSGNKPYLVNSFYPPELKTRLLERLQVKLVIGSGRCYDGFTLVDISGFDKTRPMPERFAWENRFALSSTMTGLEAKICEFEGEAVVWQILNARDFTKDGDWMIRDYKGRIKVIMILPLFHVFGLMVSYLWYAFLGGTMVFLKDNAPETIRKTVNRHKVTHIFAPPVFFHKLYKSIMAGVAREDEKKQEKFENGIRLAYKLQNILPYPGLLLSRRLFCEVLSASLGDSPMVMISGGAHLDGEALKMINCIGYPLFNGYGTTETAITGVNFTPKISFRIDNSMGSPFSRVRYAFDADGTLIISGPTLCKRIIRFDGEESGFDTIQTNDIVRETDGRYYIVGRKSDLFIGENGENISPDTIQNALTPKSAERFCVLELDGRLALVLEYEKKRAATVILSDIENLKQELAGVSCGQYIRDIYITYQPLSGPNAIKVSRALLKKKIHDGDIELLAYRKLSEGGGSVNKDGKEKGSDTETMRLIKLAFSYALDTEVSAGAGTEINDNADFFIDCGGSSLGYMTLICELEGTFSIKINLEENQNLRTPDSFCAYINKVI